MPEDKIHCHFKCISCGGDLAYEPGTAVLKCPSCQFENKVPKSEGSVEEIDFLEHLSKIEQDKGTVEEAVIECDSCGAKTTFDPHIVSDFCPYCGSDIIIKGGSIKEMKPQSVLPFSVTKEKAEKSFESWVKSRWFAPNEFKNQAKSKKAFNGVFIPYWTYDCNTLTDYSGQRGDTYYETKTYTTTENGKSVTKTKQERKVRWRSASGRVYNSFDDILIIASHSLPHKYAKALEPWDLHKLEPYQDHYLSGFKAECYQVDLKTGFEEAKNEMDPRIDQEIKRDIGGDYQRIHSKSIKYGNITFKHILLPVWLSTYRFNDKPFRILVNARTGEVQGERPWSIWKIMFAILTTIAIIALGIFFYNYAQNNSRTYSSGPVTTLSN